MNNKLPLMVPIAMLLAGLYILFTTLGANEQVSLFQGVEIPKRFGFVLGGIGLFGGVAVLVEMLSRSSRGRAPK